MNFFRTLVMVGLVLLRILCAILALFYIFGTIWFLETWSHERFLPTAGIITSLVLCALFPITGRGSFINRIFCLLAALVLGVSSFYSYKISEEAACGTNIGDAAKSMAIKLMIVAFLYMIFTLKDVIGIKPTAYPSRTP
jgi:uncharacterized membrane protein